MVSSYTDEQLYHSLLRITVGLKFLLGKFL